MLTFQAVPNNECLLIQRAKVPGGWLVREVMDVLHDDPNRGNLQSGWEWRSSLTFIPDPEYLWEPYEKLGVL